MTIQNHQELPDTLLSLFAVVMFYVIGQAPGAFAVVNIDTTVLQPFLHSLQIIAALVAIAAGLVSLRKAFKDKTIDQ